MMIAHTKIFAYRYLSTSFAPFTTIRPQTLMKVSLYRHMKNIDQMSSVARGRSSVFNRYDLKQYSSSSPLFMSKSSHIEDIQSKNTENDQMNILMKKLRESALKKVSSSSETPSSSRAKPTSTHASSSSAMVSASKTIPTTLHNPQSSKQISLVSQGGSFGQLGLDVNIVDALTDMNFVQPTAVQRAIIPRLLAKESIVMAASTGSGKTLAFLLPVLQILLQQVSYFIL